MRPRLALVPGEPAGIGPELAVRARQQHWNAQLTVFGARASLAAARRDPGLRVAVARGCAGRRVAGADSQAPALDRGSRSPVPAAPGPNALSTLYWASGRQRARSGGSNCR